MEKESKSIYRSDTVLKSQIKLVSSLKQLNI